MQTILVTGGSGFLGRQLALSLKGRFNIILAARDNFLNQEAHRITRCEVSPLDVISIESVRDVFSEFQPDYVIHAAAIKYVDLAEKHPNECVDVNIVGSQNVARVAIEKGIKAVIGISTDKAAPPCKNIYGLSKAIMERLFCGLNGKTKTKFTCVRFGNIAWSTGSVLPIWRTMISEKGLIETTGPHMRRFFFTVNEASDLVKTAIDNLEIVQGKVLSQKMKAAQIEDLLRVFIAHYGGKYEKTTERQGDSIDETLIGISELPNTSQILLGNLNYFLVDFYEKTDKPLPDVINSSNAERLSLEEMKRIVKNPPIFV